MPLKYLCFSINSLNGNKYPSHSDGNLKFASIIVSLQKKIIIFFKKRKSINKQKQHKINILLKKRENWEHVRRFVWYKNFQMNMNKNL